jgi:hypothetical protein
LEVEPVALSGFRTLRQDRGYYLSDPQTFTRIHRNLQNRCQRQGIELAEIFDEGQPLPAQKQSTYIIQNGLPTEHYRKSKGFGPQQLKAQLSFTVTQQHAQALEVNQNQTLQQQQDLSQQQMLSQMQTQHQQPVEYMGFNLFRTTVSFADFSDILLSKAIAYRGRTDIKLLRFNDYYTQYHFETNFMSRLIRDPDFRLKVTATIFGRCPHYSNIMWGLGNHSFIQIDARLTDYLLNDIAQIADGLDDKSLVIEEGFSSILMSPLHRPSTLIGYSGTVYDSEPRFIPHLSVLSLGVPHSFQQVFKTTIALLREEDCEHYTPPAREQLQQVIQALLSVFSPIGPHNLEDEHLFRRNLLVLFRVHCPNVDLSIFEKFLQSFPILSRDHRKIMLYLIVRGYSRHAEQFLLLLNALEQRALLENFRKIYFDYALTMDVVADLFLQKSSDISKIFQVVRRSDLSLIDEPTPFIESPDLCQSLFLVLAQRTPISQDPTEWPPFETFAHHFLLYTSKQGIDTQHIDIKTLQKFWHGIDAKMYRYYHGEREATDQGMQLFVDKIICGECGLVIAPVCQAMTVLNGLDIMIASAIQHDMLTEQLREWNDVSLLRTDAVHACVHNAFTVVTQEMAIDITQLRPLGEKEDIFLAGDYVKSSYRFSAQDLKTLLNKQCIVVNGSYDIFCIKIYRYLGCQTLREPIDFYRQLHQVNNAQTDPIYVYFRHMLWGYFVLTHTGADYTQLIDPSMLYQNFLNYLLKKEYIPEHNDYGVEATPNAAKPDLTRSMHAQIRGELDDVIKTCVRDFCLGLGAIKVEKSEHNAYSLWGFYNQYRPEALWVAKGFSWLGLSSEPTFETIPVVFKKKFSMQRLTDFFLANQDELKKSAHIFSHSSYILKALVAAKIRETLTITLNNRIKLLTQRLCNQKKKCYLLGSRVCFQR